MVVTKRAFDLKSLRSSNKVSLLTGEQTPKHRTEINNVEYKRKQETKCIITLNHDLIWGGFRSTYLLQAVPSFEVVSEALTCYKLFPPLRWFRQHLLAMTCSPLWGCFGSTYLLWPAPSFEVVSEALTCYKLFPLWGCFGSTYLLWAVPFTPFRRRWAGLSRRTFSGWEDNSSSMVWPLPFRVRGLAAIEFNLKWTTNDRSCFLLSHESKHPGSITGAGKNFVPL